MENIVALTLRFANFPNLADILFELFTFTWMWLWLLPVQRDNNKMQNVAVNCCAVHLLKNMVSIASEAPGGQWEAERVLEWILKICLYV